MIPVWSVLTGEYFMWLNPQRRMAGAPNKFTLEAMEPRIMLSADNALLLSHAHDLLTAQSDQAIIVQASELPAGSDSHVPGSAPSFDLFEGLTGAEAATNAAVPEPSRARSVRKAGPETTAQPDGPAQDDPAPSPFKTHGDELTPGADGPVSADPQASPQEARSQNDSGLVSAESGSSAKPVNVSGDHDRQSGSSPATVTTSSGWPDVLVETLRAANGPPSAGFDSLSQVAASDTTHLEDLRLVDQDLSLLSGQVFYLDFDGASGVVYNGPVHVDNIQVPQFKAPGDFVGQEDTIISSVLTALNRSFAELGVSFTTFRASPALPYSTIYVGANGSAFSQYGSFVGLAEKVDVGNRDRSDKAFVFSDTLYRPGLSAEDYASKLTEVVEHEARHLLGYERRWNRAQWGGGCRSTATFTGNSDLAGARTGSGK
ncbi:MAG: hypothetical protein DME19_17175 [Verrucomicrobia bacterium]|nr:MAG: hypothetical protein DME19_17175 [Verrucomicrobiota bacterium]